MDEAGWPEARDQGPGKSLSVPALVWLAVPLAFFLYFYHLQATGLVGPDEPRYASVAREMARSGDWVTPRLWGEPWFEKPALLYWMEAAGFGLGLSAELAARLPVAILAVLFLGFYWWILRREFGCSAAWLSTLILGTSVGWVSLGQIGVPDLPLAATFSSAMLLTLPWIGKGDTRLLSLAATMLGLAVLAKGLVALVLALPVGLAGYLRGRAGGRRPGAMAGFSTGCLRDLLHWRVVIPFLVIGVPWYALCYARNGRLFLDVLFGQQTFERFYSAELRHLQPWWFYIPVLTVGLLPWTPLLLLAIRQRLWRDPQRRFLLAWLLFGFVFFSAASNKLPAYVLPLLPPSAALMGIALDEAREWRPWLAGCALLLTAYPIAAQILPEAAASGLSNSHWPQWNWIGILPAVIAGFLFTAPFRTRPVVSVAVLTACATAGVVYLKLAALPQLDRLASARGLWNEIRSQADDICVDSIHRNWRYGLNFYSVTPLPDCTRAPKRLVLRQGQGGVPGI